MADNLFEATANIESIEIKQKIAKLLDDLGEYKISKSNNDLV